MSKRSDTYSIRQIVDLTGISEYTLRGWELRHHAFQPQRSSTGRRKYSQSDLQRAILLRELILRKCRIGTIARLAKADLQNLLQSKIIKTRPHVHLGSLIEKILTHVSLQEWDKVEKELRHTLQREKPDTILTNLIATLLTEFSGRVNSGLISISQEHIFSGIVKQTLSAIQSNAKVRKHSMRFVIAAPEGDFHELGILTAHTLITQAGFRSVFMGANTPKRDLCEAALRTRASHIVVGSTISRKEGAREDLYSYLHFLDQHLSPKMTFWLGGRNTFSSPLTSRSIKIFDSLKDLASSLRD